MMETSYKPVHFFYLLIVLCFLLFSRLGSPTIYILDEAKNAQCAREMLLHKEFIVPTFNGELRTDKPPLHYFFMIAAYKIFGINEFSARFFSAVFGLLTVITTYFFSKKFLSSFSAYCAALVLTLSTHFLFEFRLAVPDPYLIYFITLGLLSGFIWLQENKKLYLLLCAVSLGFGILAKGPVALVLPGLCFLIWIICKRKWKTAFTVWLVPAFVLLCLISLPWYLAVDKATNSLWTKGFFIQNNLNRFSNPQEDGHGGFFFITVIFILIGLMPFTIFSGEIFKKRKIIFKKEIIQFAFIVVSVFVIFFCISSTRLPNYPMPCYPFAALILGYYISELLNERLSKKKYPYYIIAAFILIISIAGFIVLPQEKEVAQLKSISLLILIPFAAFIILLFKSNSEIKKIRAILIAYTLFNIIGLLYIYPKLYSQNPVSKTMGLINKNAPVFSYHSYNAGYNFYLQNSIKEFQNKDSLQIALEQNPGATIIIRDDVIDSLISLHLKVIAKHHDIFEIPTTVVLKK